MKPEIIFGEKKFSELFALLEKNNLSKPLLVCGKHFRKTPHYKLFCEKIPSFVLFDSVEPNPSTRSVDSCARLLNERNCDCIIGIGGGSVLDASKVVAVMKNFEGSCNSFYDSFDSMVERVPFFALPTTSGTGSEATKYSVLTTPDGNKETLRSELLYAHTAIVDPELTYSMPSCITATTGLDAFCQAVEAHWSLNATSETLPLSEKAIRLAFQNLAKAVDSPDADSRRAMSLASITAARAFDTTGTTAPHSISYAFTKLFGLPHGYAVALTLPWFLGFYSQANEKRCLEVCSFLGADSIEGGRGKIVSLMSSLNAPIKLRDIGCNENDFERIVPLCLAHKQGNPRKHSKEDVLAMLRELI